MRADADGRKIGRGRRRFYERDRPRRRPSSSSESSAFPSSSLRERLQLDLGGVVPRGAPRFRPSGLEEERSRRGRGRGEQIDAASLPRGHASPGGPHPLWRPSFDSPLTAASYERQREHQGPQGPQSDARKRRSEPRVRRRAQVQQPAPGGGLRGLQGRSPRDSRRDEGPRPRRSSRIKARRVGVRRRACRRVPVPVAEGQRAFI